MLIAIDHGNKQIKTVHTQPFTSGLIQGDTPGFGTDCLAYQGKYYTLTDQRIPYRRDKTEDERFFILTLFAIAYEIEAMGRYSDTLMRVQLAVGLPPAHFGVQAKRFINYFDGRGAISFQFRGKPYAVYIENTACFPQSFSAAVATVKNLTASPKVLVVDIGGFTADYVRLRNGVPDMSACDSLENGVILLYNRVRARANAELVFFWTRARSTASCAESTAMWLRRLWSWWRRKRRSSSTTCSAVCGNGCWSSSLAG